MIIVGNFEQLYDAHNEVYFYTRSTSDHETNEMAIHYCDDQWIGKKSFFLKIGNMNGSVAVKEFITDDNTTIVINDISSILVLLACCGKPCDNTEHLDKFDEYFYQELEEVYVRSE
jgi:hypothetical protein